jgi:hypothetical protein
VTIAFASRVNEYRWVPIERSPEVLADRAGLAAELGYGATAGGTHGVTSGTAHSSTGNPTRFRQRCAGAVWEKGQPLVYAFWYRQDPFPSNRSASAAVGRKRSTAATRRCVTPARSR